MSVKSHISGPAFESPDDMPASLWTYIQSQVTLFPDGTFTEIYEDGQTQTVTYSETLFQARKIYSALKAKDLQVGTEVVLCFDSVLDFIPSAWACILCGHTWIPWSTSELERNEKGFAAGFQSLLKKLESPWIITSTMAEKLLGLNHITLDRQKLIDIHSLKHTRQSSEIDQIVYEDCSGQGECLITTSGTTGQPKLACVPNSIMLNRITSNKLRVLENSFSDKADTNKDENILHCFPLHSTTGMSILFPIFSHNVYFSPDRLASHPQDLLTTAEHLRIQRFSLSSYMAAMLFDSIDRRKFQYDLSSLKKLSFGSDFIMPKIIEKLILRFQSFGAQNIDIGFGYGMAECGLICYSEFSVKHLLDRLKDNVHLPDVGKCAAGVNLRIVDGQEQAVSEGQTGNIQIKSEQKLFTEYRGDAELTRKCFTSNGWFKTGDIGHIKEGKLTLTGREKTKLIINGKNISFEQIETPLCSFPGLRQAIIIATSILTKESISEELAIFFVPESFAEPSLSKLGDKIIREVAHNTHVNVKHLIPLENKDIERTATGKIRRDQMVKRYSQGEWQNLISKNPTIKKYAPLAEGAYMPELWKDILELNITPSLDENFFYLGGDSLKAARLISEIETEFNCQLPLTVFYKNPTINTLQEILDSLEGSSSRISSKEIALTTPLIAGQKLNDAQLLHKIETYIGSWRGDRHFESDLIVGMNTQGWKPPIFWVFQSNNEFTELGNQLGPYQPLYGMRSCAEIIKVKDYTADSIQAVVDRYLQEILALPVDHPMILGGNCQGGIIALALAKQLKQIGKAPAILVLMEWSFSFGMYTEPVLFLYGKQSHTAEIYTNPKTAKIDWRHDFSNHKVSPIPGAHGQFFEEPNIQSLADILSRNNTIKIK